MADKIVQLIDKNDDNIFPLASDPNAAKITMTTTDPGEGATLGQNEFVAVYGGDPIILDYATTEINTGAKWINGNAIYKKTINFGTLPNATTKEVAHNISGISLIIKIDGFFYNPNTMIFSPLPQNCNGNPNMFNGNVLTMVAGANDVKIYCSTNMSTQTAYITLYYTKTY